MKFFDKKISNSVKIDFIPSRIKGHKIVTKREAYSVFACDNIPEGKKVAEHLTGLLYLAKK